MLVLERSLLWAQAPPGWRAGAAPSVTRPMACTPTDGRPTKDFSPIPA